MHLAPVWPWLFWIWTGSEAVLALSTHTRSSEGAISDRGSLVLLWISILGAIFASNWAHAAIPSAGFKASPWLNPVTIILMLAGLAIRWSAILSLGRSFSVNVAIHSAQTVYRHGLYRLVRHPSYSGLLLIFLALGLRARNLVGLAIMVVVPAAALLYRIHVEEQALHHAFGPEYAVYSRTTRRLIPGIY